MVVGSWQVVDFVGFDLTGLDFFLPCHLFSPFCHPERGETESKDPLRSERQGISPLATLGRNDRVENLEIIWGNVLKEFSCHPRVPCHPGPVFQRGKLSRDLDIQLKKDSGFRRNDSAECLNDEYKVVANLPYQITSNVIRVFLEAENQPSTMTLMVQKEVAERICAKPGDMSLLALSVQYYADPEIIAQVPRTLFWPEPAVDSAIIKLTIRERCHLERGGDESRDPLKSERQGISPLVTLGRNDKCVQTGDFEKRFFHLVKAGFAQKRKLLIKNLLPIVGKEKKDQIKALFLQLGLSETVRAQELSLDQWKEIVKLLNC